MRVVKPLYTVPSMRSIKAIRWNGFNVVTTFAGGGGSSLGYRMAGFKILYANEFIEAARDTYNANKSLDTFLDPSDIREIDAEHIKNKIGDKQIDILDGSPPCASFSTSGRRNKLWGQVKLYSDAKQRTDDLFYEYIRILKGLQPRAFIAENVSGLVKGTSKGYFLDILQQLKNTGYQVSVKVLDAQRLGVPQVRKRVIFIGIRNDLKRCPKHPKPLKYVYTLADALDIVKPEINSEAEFDEYALAKKWDSLSLGEQHKKNFDLIRCHPHRPVPTVVAIGGRGAIPSVTHPFERRKFYIQELKAICSFPQDFKLLGNYKQQYERLGRAVPPIMMRHIASAVRDTLNENS